MLKIFSALFEQLVHGTPGFFRRWLPGSFGVPDMPVAIAAYLWGQPFSRGLCWLSVMANFCSMLLTISIVGHFIIGTCRMAGFNALRNTYRPLAATSIAEFYNRIYYYFKELLVDFFFYPAYLRYFKDRPRLRLFSRVNALAAGLLSGNMLYHILASLGAASQIGLWRTIVGFQIYAVYVLILGLAIGVSQIRSLRRRPGQRRTGQHFRGDVILLPDHGPGFPQSQLVHRRLRIFPSKPVYSILEIILCKNEKS